MDFDKLSEKEIIKLAQNKDEKAMEFLLVRYKEIPTSCVRIHSLFLKNGGDENDLLQEGMIAMVGAINSYVENKASLKTYLFTCVKNRMISVINQSNSKKNSPLNDCEPFSLNFEVDDEKNKFLKDLDFSPEEKLIHKESFEELMIKVKQILTKNEYEIFQIYIKGENYVNIAKLVNKSVKSVDNAIQRIKKKIKKLYQK